MEGNTQEVPIQSWVEERLFEMQDTAYRDFHSKLTPNVEKSLVIGVRTPALRDFAKKFYRENPEGARDFMKKLPHHYYEENNLHGCLIGLFAKKPEEALDMVDRFLPYVDNWATCDMMPPKCFKKDLPLVRQRLIPWLDSREEYRVRFAVVCLLSFFLEEGFMEEDLLRLAAIHREEYYINMAIAWYYSFALIKQYEKTIGLFESDRLDLWIHNKSIQKACESYRVPAEQKAYLRSLRRKGEKE
ncbi:MAG: DNA alkylation repair protein [Firmicutes bacterium]|nr:DNA alkylation repair protein [Bacillota bacterium]